MNRSAWLCLRAARAVAFSLGLAALPALTGCSAVKVKLGMRLALDKIPATSMQASFPAGPAIAPGEKSPLIVEIAASDGKTYVTEGAGKGKILWKDLQIISSVVTADKKGNISLAHDPRLSEGKTGRLTITAPSHPGLQAELDVPLRYNFPFHAIYSGASGMNGTDGTNGISGTTGLPGSTDPNNPSAGGNGSDGTDGGNGSNGLDGLNGPAVEARITLYPGGPAPLLEAEVTTASQKARYYLIDPQGGSLTITSTGGSGGKGGAAGKGGRGGSGGIGQPNGNSGHDGRDGQAGSNGQDGRGGSITVLYDPQVQPYLTTIHISSSDGPKPVFQQQPIPPLW